MQFFMRYEKKYLITDKQAVILENALLRHMGIDKCDKYWVQNLYFDTDDWKVIRTSMQKPYYKEKMRLRCYGTPEAGDKIFLELKKKYAGIVYKRRIALLLQDLSQPLEDVLEKYSSQIARELSFYLQSNKVTERMFVAYRRKAFASKEDPGLRVTFDSDIRYRPSELNFDLPGHGHRQSLLYMTNLAFYRYG